MVFLVIFLGIWSFFCQKSKIKLFHTKNVLYIIFFSKEKFKFWCLRRAEKYFCHLISIILVLCDTQSSLLKCHISQFPILKFSWKLKFIDLREVIFWSFFSVLFFYIENLVIFLLKFGHFLVIFLDPIWSFFSKISVATLNELKNTFFS